MSDSVVKCDGCGAFGRRVEDAAAPDFWFFIAAEDRTTGRHGIFVIWACSPECRDGMWKPGPARNFIDKKGTFHMREKKAKAKP